MPLDIAYRPFELPADVQVVKADACPAVVEPINEHAPRDFAARVRRRDMRSIRRALRGPSVRAINSSSLI
ncbi:MAG: hypothetical protein B7X78_09675 [Sphingomonadales bacterium 39-62-4]|nr:MAG: hypothetical protein B7X78_09675 [Sphingomonadales bacterium 39-62-4]